MATVKYDISDVEAGGGGVEPTPGLYPGKIVSVTHRKAKNDGTKISDLEVVVDIGQEYVRLWTYIKLPDDPSYENAKWKLRELTDALGLPPKGNLDPDKISKKKPDVMVKTKMRRDDPERAEIKNLFKPGSETVKPDEAAALANEGGDDYTEWSQEDLIAEIEDRGLEMPTGRKSTDKLIAVLEADDDATGEAANDDGDGNGGEGGEGVEFDIKEVEGYEDFDEWSNDDLKEVLGELEIKLDGRFSEAKARAAIIEAVQAESGGGEPAAEGGEPTTEDDYDEWSLDELKEEISDRNKDGAEISVTGRVTKDKAIAALREDDAKDPF